VPHVRAAIIGAGFGGLGAAIRLRENGIDDVVVLERAEQVGGTWHQNAYPGCACDVPSHLYSFSFALNPDWSRMFAPQTEILDYILRCAEEHGLREIIRLGTAVRSARWDPEHGHWRLETSRGPLTAQADIQARLGGTVWVDGGCKSWYLDAQGVNRTLWPTFSNAFKRRLRAFDLADFKTAPAESVPDTDRAPRTHDDKEYV
jgi:phytoene dehydrogenase-like protein